MALIILVNSKDIRSAHDGLTKAGVAEDAASGVLIASCALDGGELRAASEIYRPDGGTLDLHFRQLAKAPADQLPASAN